jgi:hypothetical protein
VRSGIGALPCDAPLCRDPLCLQPYPPNIYEAPLSAWLDTSTFRPPKLMLPLDVSLIPDFKWDMRSGSGPALGHAPWPGGYFKRNHRASLEKFAVASSATDKMKREKTSRLDVRDACTCAPPDTQRVAR